jgi:hypothetical protein
MKSGMTAIALERLLLISIALMIVGTIFAFSSVNKVLNERARATNHKKIDAEIGRDTIDRLRFLDTYIQDNKSTIDRAASIVANSKQYSYQNQIVTDINTLASRADVSVLGYSFATKSQQKSSHIVAGLKTITVDLTLKSPLPYSNFLRFLKAIEQHLTKMQVSGVSLTPDQGGSGSNIANPTIGLEVYVK